MPANNIFILSLLLLFAHQGFCQVEATAVPPNFIIIFADDLGYGDLSCYGSPGIRTPHLDRMAGEGQKWTNFYVGASVCTPSRAALLTGRLPVRSGMASDKRAVLFPDSPNGLPPSELTLAEQLKSVGYRTACVGKWHLGHNPDYLPTSNGFDSYFGIPYSNDMDRMSDLKYAEFWQDSSSNNIESFQVPLMRNTEIVERPADQRTITRRYTDESISFIRKNKEQPFFLYLAHNLPHVPLFASGAFLGKSPRGLYGDVVEEIDDGVGRILTALKEERLDRNTIVVFTSDNGPWLSFGLLGGSAGQLRAGKGTTWEGGMREPCIVWGPGKIAPGLISDIGSTMDLFTTFSSLAGAPVPGDRIIDGLDLSGTFLRGEASVREHLFYYRGTHLHAVRLGDYKAHFITKGAYGMFGEREVHAVPILYNLSVDPAEKYDVAADHPEVLREIAKLVEAHKSNMVMGKDQLRGD